MKAVVAAFNQEKALVGAFSVITNPRMELFEALIQVVVDTMDGSAVAGEDYVAVHKLVTFAPGVTELEVTMEVINDDAWEPAWPCAIIT